MSDDVKADMEADTDDAPEAESTEDGGGKAPAKADAKPAKEKTWTELLAEFSQADDEPPAKKAEPQKAPSRGATPDIPSEFKEMMEFYKAQRAERTQNSVLEDMVNFDEELAEYPADLVKSLAIGKLILNPDLEAAFNARGERKGMWNAVGKALASDLKKALKSVNAAKTADEDTKPAPKGSAAAAKAASRAQEKPSDRSTEAKAQDEKVLGMSNAERIAFWRRQGINLGL